MEMQRYTFRELPPVEQAALKTNYGIVTMGDVVSGKRSFLYARELTGEESQFFGRRSVSPYFFEQTLYKVQGKLLPNKLNMAIGKMVAQTDALRANYLTVEGHALCVVFAEREDLPLPLYRNLEHEDGEEQEASLKKLREADMRETFDLAKGNLVRFAVLHTGENEYAVLVTAARLIADSFDVAALLRAAMEGVSYAPQTKLDRAKNIGSLAAPIREYWRRVLTDFPSPTTIPYAQEANHGAYRQKSFRLALPADLMSELRREAKSNRLMLLAILETAWGLVLKQFSPESGIALCLLVPERQLPGKEGSGAFNLIPSRLDLPGEETCEQLVHGAFQQFIVARPYAGFDWSGLSELTDKRESLFNHFLSFYDFLTEGTSYARCRATPEGQLVEHTAWDAQGMGLGIYFRDDDETVSATFLYDEGQFAKEGIPRLAKRYLLTLQQMLTDWNLPSAAFLERLTERLEAQRALEQATVAQPRNILQDVLSKLAFLQGATLGTLQQLMRIASLKTYFEGDRLAKEEMVGNLLFVAEGSLVRSMDAGDGWYNMLDLVGKNQWLNETALLHESTSHLSAEVLSEEATIVFLPLEAMLSVLRAEPDVKENLFQHVLSEMEKYQKRWVQN
ncbi:MAG: hypothetical protein IJ849_01255 [Selenomonadaceae bacterium]|nr:hypothetical protein [Selenomonadaceae bacterium]